MHINPQLLKDINSNPFTILEKLSVKEIATLLTQANHAYHTDGKPLFSDDIYEIIRSYLMKLVPDHPLVQTDVVGAVPQKSKVVLPMYMGSLNKVKDDPGFLEKWKNKYNGEYIISDKLDGISCLYYYKDNTVKLFTRGDGTHGQDISRLLKYIQGIPQPKTDAATFIVRGELILTKRDWETLKEQHNNPRNTVAGIANSKTPNPNTAKLVHFVAYEVVSPRMVPSDSFEWLTKAKFEVVHHTKCKGTAIHVDNLSKVLIDRREKGPYEIDGIVVTHNAIHNIPVGDNPAYAFAFKSILTMEKAEVIVKDIEWNISKHGLLKPVVTFDTVYISGVHINRAYGQNAKFIDKNVIGPGSRIVIIRSGEVIPYILSVLSPAAAGKPLMPDPIQYPWKWNESNVEIVLVNPELAQDYHLRQLENYVTVMGIKGMGAKVLKKLYDRGIDTVKKIVNVTKMDLYRATLSSKTTMKIYNQMQHIYRNGSCAEFMAASNLFGNGFGRRKFQLIIAAVPSVLDRDHPPPLLSDLTSTKGLGEKFARSFLEHFEEFHEFMENAGLQCRSDVIDKIEEVPEGQMALNGKTIVFTGFRSKPLEDYIVKRGGKVSTSVSAKTSILVAKLVGEQNIKVELATEYGVPILSLKDFQEDIGFVEGNGIVQEDEDDDEFKKMQDELEEEGAFDEVDEDDTAVENTLSKRAECVRHGLNWANIKRGHIFGKSGFDTNLVADDLDQFSPKLNALIEKIAALDAKDMAKDGVHYKHMIFSDVMKYGYGAKIIGAGLSASGWNHAYNKEFTISNKALQRNKGRNFAILAATQVYTKPISVPFKQKLLATFNTRPDNVQGDLIRIIVLDTGYKEGVDLFDVKYVHLFEPLLTYADEQQAIGRATRFCGQKGLHFDATHGWKLHVYKYDHVLRPELEKEFGGRTSFELISKEMSWNTNLVSLSKEIEKVCHDSSVDKTLTKTIHAFTHKPPPVTHKAPPVTGGAYNEYKWPPVRMENLCTSDNAPKNGVLEFSPSQEFVRHYFVPSSPLKGMFLWHSLGSGKTCTAIAAASTSWEAEGYTILWVTRGTLRSDVYKNMFDMSCVERIRDVLRSGKTLPITMAARKRMLSKSWVPPISYKQFNNTLQRQNRLYDFLIKRNGYTDPFKRTLLIIDEAHLMLSPTMKAKDKPDIALLKAWLRNSFKKSGEASARVILMSATPITNDPFSFTKLMNLSDTKDMPEDSDSFTRRYLASDLSFTEAGKKLFAKDVKGRISYLNRTKDVRQFTQPVIHNVEVPISEPADLAVFLNDIQAHENLINELKDIKLTALKKKAADDIETRYQQAVVDCGKRKDCISAAKAARKGEKDLVDENARKQVAEAKDRMANEKELLKQAKKDLKEVKRADTSILSILQNKCYKKPKYKNKDKHKDKEDEDKDEAEAEE